MVERVALAVVWSNDLRQATGGLDIRRIHVFDEKNDEIWKFRTVLGQESSLL